MNIAAVVILYYPEESIVRNIDSYLPFVQKLYILDNSENASFQLSGSFSSTGKIIYRSDGENKGIAIRLNEAVQLAGTDGFDYLLTMDQDSFFDGKNIQNYLRCVQGFEDPQNVSVFGLSFETRNSSFENCNSREVMHLITSGSLINLAVNKVVGPFDENLFIDEVDFEYCLRSVQKGFKNICFANIFLDHQLGKSSTHRSFKNAAKTTRSLHAPERIYYMVRNFFYLQEKYHDVFSQEMNLRKRILLNRLKNNILYNHRRFNVFQNIIKGYNDYKKYRMGKAK